MLYLIRLIALLLRQTRDWLLENPDFVAILVLTVSAVVFARHWGIL